MNIGCCIQLKSDCQYELEVSSLHQLRNIFFTAKIGE